MAVKKMSKTESAAASEPKAATKRRGAKKASAPKSVEANDVAVASETATKTATPKSAGTKAAPAKEGAKKGATEVKLNDRQREFLKKINEAGEPGYLIGQKVEKRTIEALAARKLLKRGPKHKESGEYHYVLTKLGQKHLGSMGNAEAQPS